MQHCFEGSLSTTWRVNMGWRKRRARYYSHHIICECMCGRDAYMDILLLVCRKSSVYMELVVQIPPEAVYDESRTGRTGDRLMCSLVLRNISKFKRQLTIRSRWKMSNCHVIKLSYSFPTNFSSVIIKGPVRESTLISSIPYRSGTASMVDNKN